MKIIAAIDLVNGQVVRGVAGQREQYARLKTCLAESACPADVAHGLVTELGVGDFYVADLDAIAGAEPACELYEQMLSQGRHLWIDAGLADIARGSELLEFAQRHQGTTDIIVGLESIASRDQLRSLVDAIPAESLIFSLDLKSGRPWGAAEDWREADPLEIVADVVELGIRQFIVLDLAAVGVDEGCPTLPLVRILREKFSDVTLEIATGGGVRGPSDLEQLAEAGCDVALVASALHDGRLTRQDLACWRNRNADG